MRKWLMAGIAMLTIAISSVSTRSIKADSVLARSSYCYLGCIKDPETGAYITSDFTTQFTILENEASYLFAEKQSITSLDATGEPIATECNLNIIINDYMGDSLAAMKLIVEELDKPIEENRPYYSNFNPEASGYVRKDGLKQAKVYSMTDMTLSDSLRYVRQKNNYYSYISVPLSKQYKAKDGTTYQNYGTYLMRTFYKHPEYFKNSISFVKNVCPGFYTVYQG